MALKHRFILLMFAATLTTSLHGCSAPAPAVSIHTAYGETVDVAVDVARTARERSLGLMFRTELGDNEGMLFIFPSPRKQNFTMKNTFIPLDMIFIDREKRIVGWVENARPLTNGPYTVDQPSQYVLEVNAFFCRDRDIREGDSISFHNIPE